MRVFVVAEIGSVHDGSFGNAKQAVFLAKQCGADAVKFQVHISAAETLKTAPAPSYFNTERRWDYFKRTAFTLAQWKEIKTFCDETGIEFMASPFSEEAVELMRKVGMRVWKIPSGEVTNLPLLKKIASYGQYVILSSGMSSWEELDKAVKVIRSANSKCKTTILQCTSEYPCPYERVGLNIMEQMAKRFELSVGLSDHTLDIFVPIVAVSRGASVIEKHLTFSRSMYGSDARHSLEPEDFAQMVKGIRVAEKILASPIDKDKVLKRYRKMKKIFQKSIVASSDLPAGRRLVREDLDFKKPGTGISAADADFVIGKTLARAVRKDQMLSRRDFSNHWR